LSKPLLHQIQQKSGFWARFGRFFSQKQVFSLFRAGLEDI
jgi:hypothetical protein